MLLLTLLIGFFVIINLLFVLRHLKNGLESKNIYLSKTTRAQLYNGDRVKNFLLHNHLQQEVSLESLLEKVTVLLVIDTNCDVCDLDLKEFADESLVYGHAYNFVPIVFNPMKIYDKLNIKRHSFKEILFANQSFIEDYKISLFPTFIVVDTDGNFVSYVNFTRELKHFFDPQLASKNQPIYY